MAPLRAAKASWALPKAASTRGYWRWLRISAIMTWGNWWIPCVLSVSVSH